MGPMGHDAIRGLAASFQEVRHGQHRPFQAACDVHPMVTIQVASSKSKYDDITI